MSRKTHILVSYDITDDSLRHEFSEELKNLGLEREQYSLFSGYIPVQRVKSVVDLAEEHREEGDCRIKIIRLCKNCVKKMIEFPGRGEEPDDYRII